jgi:hypothetical protein
MKLIRDALTLRNRQEEQKARAADTPVALHRLVLSDSSALDEMIVRLYQSLEPHHKRQFWQLCGSAFEKLLFLTEHGRDPRARR